MCALEHKGCRFLLDFLSYRFGFLCSFFPLLFSFHLLSFHSFVIFLSALLPFYLSLPTKLFSGSLRLPARLTGLFCKGHSCCLCCCPVFLQNCVT